MQIARQDNSLHLSARPATRAFFLEYTLRQCRLHTRTIPNTCRHDPQLVLSSWCRYSGAHGWRVPRGASPQRSYLGLWCFVINPHTQVSLFARWSFEVCITGFQIDSALIPFLQSCRRGAWTERGGEPPDSRPAPASNDIRLIALCSIGSMMLRTMKS